MSLSVFKFCAVSILLHSAGVTSGRFSVGGGTGEMSSEGVSHSPRIEAVGFTIVCVTF